MDSEVGFLIKPLIFKEDEVDKYISHRITRMRLKELRKMHHMSQKELSEMTGLSTQCISDIESETGGNPTLKSIMKYLDAFGYEIAFEPMVL